MKRILVLGAGKSSPSLIRYLLSNADEYDWQVVVADLDEAVAAERIGGHARGQVLSFDVNDPVQLRDQIGQSDIVVNFLTPRFMERVAVECVQAGVPMVSASYRSRELREIGNKAAEAGIILLSEMGLDPGMDLMSAMEIIQRVKADGGKITGFSSYGSGLAAHDKKSNPLGYVLTWNPYNVVQAGRAGAQYLEDGRIKILPYHRVFTQTWPVEVEGVGTLEAYANRDSLSYKQQFGIDEATTMIRGTLRYPGWSELWTQIIQLGLTDENLPIPKLDKLSMRDVVRMFLPLNIEDGNDIEARVANYLGISPTGQAMMHMRWLGLFDEAVRGFKGKTAGDALLELISEKLAPPPDGRDQVVLLHRMEVEYPDTGKRERIISTFVAYGDAAGETAMAKTVGLPAAIGVKMILNGEIDLVGSQIPTVPEIYEPVLRELGELGLAFEERTEEID